MLQEAKEKYPEKALYCASAWEIPVPEAYYDAVCSMHLLMHLTKVRFRDILTEVHRVLQPNGLFIFDLPAAWRRRKLQYTSKGWHGNTAYDIPEIKSFLGNNWEFVDYKGILLLPIHQFPKPIRKQFLRLDAFLNKYFLKYYASYYLITLRKKP
ncbi:MAG: class I SAM-dependent methyltransferase, partial [Flammeovirgaceae bacterium]